MDNIVFYFSGTGNCLKIAKTIANKLDNVEIVSMSKSEKYSLKKQYDTIGFVYPVYFCGIPNAVRNFIEKTDFANNKNSYFYAIATYGGICGNGISQLNELLMDKHNIKLNFGKKLKMFANYIVAYKMSDKINEITKKSDKEIIPMLNEIKSRKNNKIIKANKMLNKFYFKNIDNFKNMDKKYIVNDNCTGCEICKMVCPVKNIEIVNKKPIFKHNCEQCVACIQYCPQMAINYKNITDSRKRYTNPEISYKELSDMNNG